MLLGLSWLIKSLPSPKQIYIFFFWFQLIMGLLVIVCILFFCKQEYDTDGKWGTNLFVIVLLILIYINLFGSMFMDIPNLLMSKYETVEGQPKKVWQPYKSCTVHADIGGKEVEFFHESIMREKENRQKYYHVEYLPNSNYVIDVKEIEK